MPGLNRDLIPFELLEVLNSNITNIEIRNVDDIVGLVCILSEVQSSTVAFVTIVLAYSNSSIDSIQNKHVDNISLDQINPFGYLLEIVPLKRSTVYASSNHVM